MTRIYWLLFSFILLVLANCKTPQNTLSRVTPSEIKDTSIVLHSGPDSEKESHVYSGSGNIQVDYRLHNIWAFQEVNGQKLNPESYAKGIPVIELFVAEKKIIGHDGCNQITGTFFASGDTINFGPIESTRMTCAKEKLDFNTLLRGKYQFEFAPNQLILLRNNKAIMKLKNVD